MGAKRRRRRRPSRHASCAGCDADFRPARPWSHFCCPACRLRAHRRLAGSRSAAVSKRCPLIGRSRRRRCSDELVALHEGHRRRGGLRRR
jgi:predicted RNA-binding Zn-ribbon protein involved in translation (DUF1610 family)